MYKMCPSNEVKTASFGGNLSYWMYLFVQIWFIVLFCNRFVSNFSTRQSVKKVKIRRRRRTCADDGDTTREILRQIVCEEQSDECAICRKILSKGIPKGGNSRGRRRRARLLPPLQRVEFIDTLLRFQRHLQNRQGYVVPEKVAVSYLCVTSRTALPVPARASGTNPWSSQ